MSPHGCRIWIALNLPDPATLHGIELQAAHAEVIGHCLLQAARVMRACQVPVNQAAAMLDERSELEIIAEKEARQ
jgi:hypothetical protein